ncbi:MAG: PSD1 and planctomycete cytochrome C domain-containing protein [Armatimonadota bacterium]
MRPTGPIFAALGVAFVTACAAVGAAPPKPKAAAPPVNFEREIRPILSENCFTCHGPDPGKRQGSLRLDRKQDLFTRRGPGAPVVPGKPAESRLWVRVAAANPAHQMPPPSSGKSLTPRQKELLRRWIAQGAPWSQHWAFVAPKRPALPVVKKTEWVRNPVDRFILSRLEKERMAPSAEADRATLLRRLSLDLTGLPPTPEEVDAFLADRRPDAYERQVERLLASPHYGERWARHWLDAARYADSDGFEKDKQRWVWFYRDWVINAFNRDLPYDRFIIAQLAGDLLPNATQDQVVATGFLRNSMINEEGGVDPEQFRMEAMFDRMDALGKSVLGLTVQCAQCHTHKYDPITQEEYYRLFAFLNNSDEANVAVYTPPAQQKRAEIFRRMREIEDRLKHETPDWRARMATWELQAKQGTPAWEVVRPELDASGGQKHYLLDDGSILAQGYAPTKHTTDFTVRVDGTPITAVRLELLNDPNLPRGGPGRSIFGLSALTEFRLEVAPADEPGKRQPVKISSAWADVNPAERELEAIFDDRSKRRRVTGPLAYALDGKDETAWGLDIGPGRSNVPRHAIFQFAEPVSFPKGTLLTFKLTQNHGGWNSDDNQNNNLGRFRFSVTRASRFVTESLSATARAALSVAPEQRTPAQQAALFSAWRETVLEWKPASEQIERLWGEHPQPSTQLVLSERQMRRPTHLLDRGDFLKPAKEVQPGVPEVLHPLPAGAAPNRLTFAKWLVDRRSPTAARSIVNRVWQTYFGTGLVSTSEDLGTQAEPPSHPELLDWLAVELMEPSRRAAKPWSLKHLHRQIVLSATYRQSSAVTPDRLAKDPDNRLLSRGPRFRVEGEIVRDIALAASGLLNPKVGGPSVFPPAPEFLFQPPTSYGPKVWPVSTGPDRYRRALYTFRYRSVPYPVLQTFDAPNGDASCVRRVRSNTPLQALTTLNEPLFMEAARALALRTVREGGNDFSGRLVYSFRRCTGRVPTAAEANVLKDLLRKQTERFRAPGAEPWAIAAPEEAGARPELPAGVTPAELAAWTVVSRVLLNLDETITKE